VIGHATWAPAGTNCTRCLCCPAVICFGGEALCAACDDGTHPPLPESHRAPAIEPPAHNPKPIEEKQPMTIRSGNQSRKPIDPKVKAAVLAEPATVSHFDLARKYKINDVTVRQWRLDAGIIVPRPHGKRGPYRKKDKAVETAAPKPAAAQPAAQPAPPAPVLESAPVTMSVQRALLDAWWNKLNVGDKAAVFGAHYVIPVEGFVQ